MNDNDKDKRKAWLARHEALIDAFQERLRITDEESAMQVLTLLEQAFAEANEEQAHEVPGSPNNPRLLQLPLTRTVLPGYVPPPLDEIPLWPYPPASTAHPFDLTAPGSYFLYVGNRKVSLSYLGSDFADFSETKKALQDCIPMGYSTVFVLQRVFLITKGGEEYSWPPEFDHVRNENEGRKKIFWLLSPDGLLIDADAFARGDGDGDASALRYTLLDQARRVARNIITDADYPILVGMVLCSYHWH